ncbi:MAG: hypothetical protein ACYCSI_16680 [Solirubrobacteraceae bacterium]
MATQLRALGGAPRSRTQGCRPWRPNEHVEDLCAVGLARMVEFFCPSLTCSVELGGGRR